MRMTNEMISPSSDSGASEIPTHPTLAAPIPPPPVISSAPPQTVISRPAKRYIRPRATTDEEKQQRLEERKISNRTAAKQSRERQKQAMEQALQENERLKEENSLLHSRLANLEQRMAAIESKRQKSQEVSTRTSTTHQSARPMSMEQQCPTPRMTTSTNCFTSPETRILQTRVIIYLLQILMHSFVLSMTARVPLEQYLLKMLHCSHPPRHSPMVHQIPRHSSQWMGALRGYATLNLKDLSGAIRSAFIHRRRAQVVAQRQMRRTKDWIRMVRRDNRRQKRECIRLIIKKKPLKCTHGFKY